MDYIDASLACPPVAPSAIDIDMPRVSSEEPTPTGQEPGGSGGGGGFASPPGAPSALKDISPVPSLPSVRFSERAGRDYEEEEAPPPFQSPSLLDRLREYRNNARAAETEIERREWVGEAENLIDALFNPRATCWCGVVLNNLTGKCDDCLERKARIARKLAEEGEAF